MNPLLHWLTSPEWAHLVKALLHSLWQGALIVLVLALVLRRIARPEMRYRFMVGALAALLLTSIVTWSILNAPTTAAPVISPQLSLPALTPLVPTGPVEKFVVTADWTQSKPQIQWTAWLALAWLLGTAAMLGRASVKVAGAEQLRRACQPLNDPRITGLVAEARRAVKLTRRVRVAVTNQLTSPAVVGVLVPTLILPLSLITTLSPEQLRFVLLHELAHIRRGDYLANLFQLFAEALFFFNPAVWWLSHQIRREREACCDALAIELSGAPADYARTLVSVAETMLNPSPAAAPAFGNPREPSSLTDRVQRVLVPGYRPSLHLTWRALLVALLAGGVLLGLLAAGTRETIAATAALLDTKAETINPRHGLSERSVTNPAMDVVPYVSEDGYTVQMVFPTATNTINSFLKPVTPLTNVSRISALPVTNPPPEWTLSLPKPETTSPLTLTNQGPLYTRTFKISSNDLERVFGNVGPITSTNRIQIYREFCDRNGLDMKMPGKAFFYSAHAGLYVRATLPELDKIESMVKAWQTTSPTSAAATNSPSDNTSLLNRTFKVDLNTFARGLPLVGDPKTTNLTERFRNFIATFGVDLQPPKALFFNERQGVVFVRASLADLDTMEQAIQVLNIVPPQVNIRAKFVEVQANGKGDELSSFLGSVSVLPGNGTSSSALSNSVSPSGTNSPTFTGILTPAQFKVVLRALEAREGVELLSPPDVTTVSGRQAQLQVVDMRAIVSGLTTITASNGVSTNFFQTSTMPFGPTLDVVPYVSADGFTVNMTLIPVVTEFIGYQKPDPVLAKFAREKAVNAELPLPIYRMRQVATSATVWDGQTIVLGGFTSEIVTRQPDGSKTRKPDPKAPKKHLYVFITPTIIDPAGNRVHTDDQIPSMRGAVPQPKPLFPGSSH